MSNSAFMRVVGRIVAAVAADSFAEQYDGARSGGRMVNLSLLLLPLVLSAWLYFPITHNYFRGDDFLSLYMIRNLPLLAYLSELRAGHVMFTSNLLFFVAASAYGTEPVPYFWTVLFFHLVNVFLLFRLLHVLTGSRPISCFGATLWGVSRAHAETLGWFSVIGHVLVATFILCVLLGFAGVGTCSSSKRLGLRAMVWALCVVAAGGSFGVGIGIAAVMPAVAFLFLPPGSARRRVVASTIAAAAAVVALYQALHPSHGRPTLSYGVVPALQGATKRSEQLVTMAFRTAENGAASLLVGSWLDPRWPPRVATAAASLGTLALVFFALLTVPPTGRKIILAALLIAAAAYGVIAAGRVAFFVKGNDALIYAGRYQYVAQMALTLAICMALGGLARVIRLPASAGRVLLAGWIVLTVWTGAVRGPRILDNASGRREVANVLAEIRRSIERTPRGADVYIHNQVLRSFGLIGRAERLLPGWAAVFVIFYPENSVDGRRVYFVTDSVAALRAAKRGHRSATLLIPPPGGGVVDHARKRDATAPGRRGLPVLARGATLSRRARRGQRLCAGPCSGMA
jgi:hypothetical protein